MKDEPPAYDSRGVHSVCMSIEVFGREKSESLSKLSV